MMMMTRTWSVAPVLHARGMKHRRQARRLLLTSLLVLALLLFCASPAAAMKQTWRFAAEDREQFLIERFGFGAHGRMDVHIRNVSVAGAPSLREARAGLLIVHVRTAC